MRTEMCWENMELCVGQLIHSMEYCPYTRRWTMQVRTKQRQLVTWEFQCTKDPNVTLLPKDDDKMGDDHKCVCHAAPAETERMLKWFDFDHLPAELQLVSRPFCELATVICERVAPGPERTVALRKLLEAKDAAVRAKLHPGG